MPDIYHSPHHHPDADAIKSAEKLLHTQKQPIGVFSSYCVSPQNVTFVNQESDEVVILFLRRHFITNIPWLLLTSLLLFVPPLIFALSLFPNISFFTLPAGLTIVLTGFYYLIIIGYAFGNFVSWFYNIGIITQKRIVDLDTSNILSHNNATANLREIVDVKFTQQGFLQSFFNYGDIDLQTEAILANFEFHSAPHPAQAADIISDLRVAMKGAKNGST